MNNPAQVSISDSIARQVQAAADLYATHPYLSCDTSRVIEPSLSKIEVAHRTVILVATAPNDPRALALLLEAFKGVKSRDDLLILSAKGTKGREHTTPGIFTALGAALDVPQVNPFVTIANPALLNKVAEKSRLANHGFTKEQIIGSIVSNAALSDLSTTSIDTLSGVNKLLQTWNNQFPLELVLNGALELQDLRCHPMIIDNCQRCIGACVTAALRAGRDSNPENPEFIKEIISYAQEHYPQLLEKHILGYAACVLSRNENVPVPNYIHTILRAYDTWKTEITLQEIYQAVFDWLISHQPNFESVLADNAKISKIVQQVELESSVEALRALFQQRRESFIIGWCPPHVALALAKSFQQ